ncbi:MAG: hypothetical protein IJX13_00300, partial [Clostridia bacterium]|nr:hypothetical protein [Clostridia bacterium]
MKKLFCLGLCLLLVIFTLTACLNNPEDTGTTSGEETTTPVEEESTTPGGETHDHVYAAEWTTDATNHWHAATCDHKDEKKDLGAHKDENADNKCDTCAYVMAYAVTVTAPNGAVVDKAAQNVAVGADATFAVTYGVIYRLSADNATLVDSVDNEDGTVTWNFKVAAPTADTAVTVSAEQVIFGAPVDAGLVTFEGVSSAWTFYPGADITVNLEAGDYIAYFLGGDGGATLGLAADDCSTMGYAFTVEEAGEVTLVTKFMTYTKYDEATDVSLTYIIAKNEDVTLNALEGEGYLLATNVSQEIVFTVPTPGLYTFSTTAEGININEEITSSCIFMATEENQEIRISVKYEDSMNVLFDFDWSIAFVDGPALNDGANDVVISLEGYTAFTYTAPVAGSYSFVAESGNNYFYYWSTDYGFLTSDYSGSYLVKNAEAGEKILVLVKCHDYEAIDDVADVITVSYAGILVEEGENTVATNGEGTEVTFIATYEGWFNIIAGENTLIGIVGEDETVAWVSEYEIYFEGENFAFLVKTADGAEADAA